MDNNVTLVLQKSGADFELNSQEAQLSDVGCYELTTVKPYYTIKGKDGKMYALSIRGGRPRYEYRTDRKYMHRKLKRPVREKINENGLFCEVRFGDSRGYWCNSALEKKIMDKNFSYTQKDILKAVNMISEIKYTDLQIID